MSMRRVMATWLLLALAMSVNGVFREIVLRPLFGAAPADVISAVLGAAIILVVTWWFFHSLAGESTASLLRISALLVAATLAFEFLFGHYVDHKTWTELLENYAIWRGRLWPLLLLLIAISPFLWVRRTALAQGARHAR